MMADALYGLCMEDLLLTLRDEAAGAPCGLAVAYLTRDNMILWRVFCWCLRVAKIVRIDVQIANWAQLYTGSFFVPCGCCLLVVFQFPGAPKVLPPLWRGGCSTQGQCQEATEVRGELGQIWARKVCVTRLDQNETKYAVSYPAQSGLVCSVVG